MFLKDLLNVTNDCSLYMYNENTGDVITLDKDLLKNCKVFSQNPIPFIDRLKVKDIYADCGVVAEIKFDKDCYKAIKKYQKSLDKSLKI